MFGVPVVDLLVCFLFSHTRLRVRKTPGIPCALSIRRDLFLKTRAACGPREEGACAKLSWIIKASVITKAVTGLHNAARLDR
jgi:hypothetical protein